MQNLLVKVYLATHNITVIHSLPGRVRISIPGLSEVPQEYLYLQNELIKFFQNLPGIIAVELSEHSGKGLIQYDINSISEGELVNWINSEWKKLAQLVVAQDSRKVSKSAMIEVIRNTLLEDRNKWIGKSHG